MLWSFTADKKAFELFCSIPAVTQLAGNVLSVDFTSRRRPLNDNKAHGGGRPTS